MVQYFIEELRVKFRLAIDAPATKNEYNKDYSFLNFMDREDEIRNSTLYVFLLAIHNKDVSMLKYLYEDVNSHL